MELSNIWVVVVIMFFHLNTKSMNMRFFIYIIGTDSDSDAFLEVIKDGKVIMEEGGSIISN